MTHDLIKNLLTGVEATVHKVVVSELKDETFYAVIWLEQNGELISVDSRPSDALALALRLIVRSMSKSRCCKTRASAANISDKVTNEELKALVEGLNDEDLGRYKM